MPIPSFNDTHIEPSWVRPSQCDVWDIEVFACRTVLDKILNRSRYRAYGTGYKDGKSWVTGLLLTARTRDEALQGMRQLICDWVLANLEFNDYRESYTHRFNAENVCPSIENYVRG